MKGCGNKVRSALEAVDGVTKAVVTLPDQAEVTVREDVPNATLIDAIKGVGFGASVN